MRPLVELPWSVFMLDACSLGILLGVSSFLLNYVVKYVDYQSFNSNYKYFSLTLLALSFIAFWIGGGFLFLYIVFGKSVVVSFLPTLPLRLVLAGLVFGILEMFYKSIYSRDKLKEESLQEKELPKQQEEIRTDKKSEAIDHIAVKNGSKIDLIYTHEIYCIQAQGDYILIFTDKGKFLKEQTMKSCEEKLPSDKFIRVHRSSIVNKDFIARLETYEKQSYILILQNGMQIKVSLSGYKMLKTKLGF